MTDSVQTRDMTPDEKFRALFARTAKINDAVSALLSPEWGARMGIIPEGHPLHPGTQAPAADWITKGTRDLSVPEHQAADEDQAMRWARRESLLVLLSRADRGVLSSAEGRMIREHVEHEMREAYTARAVAAGNKRHVQVMYAELEQANEAARRALEQRQEMAEERHALQEQRDTADQVRSEAQRDRDQHAAVLAEVLGTFAKVLSDDEQRAVGYMGPTADPETFERWRSTVAPTVERPWWQQVAEAREQAALDLGRDLLRDGLDAFLLRLVGPDNAARILAELKQAQAAIERVRAQATAQRARGASGSTDHKIGLYDAAVAILAALDGPTETEQPDDEALHAKLDEATATLRRVRTVTKDWAPRLLPHSEAHRLFVEVRDALAGPRPDRDGPTETER